MEDKKIRYVDISRRLIGESVRGDSPSDPLPRKWIAGCATAEQIAIHYAQKSGLTGELLAYELPNGKWRVCKVQKGHTET